MDSLYQSQGTNTNHNTPANRTTTENISYSIKQLTEFSLYPNTEKKAEYDVPIWQQHHVTITIGNTPK